MLTPEYIAGLADDILGLYSELEAAILRDTVRRLIKTGVQKPYHASMNGFLNF